MKNIRTLMGCTCALLSGWYVPAYADSAVSTVNVTVVRFMTITNVSTLDFGVVSTGPNAGTVVTRTNGIRFSTGGVKIDSGATASPARFFIEGTPNRNYFVLLPQSVQLVDQNGNTMLVNQFQASSLSGQLDSNGNLDLSIGGQINLDANQHPGSYSGTLVVEVDYS